MLAKQQQYNVVIASFLGWTMDAFDFFLLIFVMGDIAKEFGSTVKVVVTATNSGGSVSQASKASSVIAAQAFANNSPWRV